MKWPRRLKNASEPLEEKEGQKNGGGGPSPRCGVEGKHQGISRDSSRRKASGGGATGARKLKEQLGQILRLRIAEEKRGPLLEETTISTLERGSRGVRPGRV